MTPKRILASACALSTLSGAGFAQFADVVDFDPIPGLEQPANRHQYLSSHNAYDSHHSLAFQLDGLNVWEIELDVRYEDDSGQSNPMDRYEVFHSCVSTNEVTLNQTLAAIRQTHRYERGVFFLNIQIGPTWADICTAWDELTPEQHDENLDFILDWHFGSAAYTRLDFLGDGSEWPSVQELVRRGKHVIPHVRYMGSEFPPERYIKRSLSVNTDLVVWNTDDENAALDDLHDYHLARYWDSCTASDWADAYSAGFNFIATDCVDEWFTSPWGNLVHPPYPMYVRTSPQGFQGGTFNRPFAGGAGIVGAVNRVKTYNALAPIAASHTTRAGIIPVMIYPGTYSISTNGQVIEGPVILQSSDGAPVTLN